jgi:truncated hemoglobin YjbI
MTFQDQSFNTAYQCGAYKAIAEMMRDAIRDMDSDNEFTAEFAVSRLKMLADQLDETEKKFKKEVDIA